MPEASNAVGFLGELDRIVYQKVREGKSALRIALEINDSQYQRSLEELRQIIGWNAHGDDRCKLWNLTTIKEVYAVKILWFRTAYEKYNGRNTDEVFRRELGIGNVYMNNDYELSEKLRNFKEREPFPLYRPYGAQNFLHGFREYVWFHASENHTTNDLYGVVQRAIGLDETERFNPQNYQEGEYQFAYKMLERLNDPWHRGDDFREVVGKFCDKECNIAEEAEWIQKIVRNFEKGLKNA